MVRAQKLILRRYNISGLSIGEVQRINVANQVKLGNMTALQASRSLAKVGAAVTTKLDMGTGKIISFKPLGKGVNEFKVTTRVNGEVVSTNVSKVNGSDSGLSNLQDLSDKGFNSHFIGN